MDLPSDFGDVRGVGSGFLKDFVDLPIDLTGFDLTFIGKEEEKLLTGLPTDLIGLLKTLGALTLGVLTL